MSGLTTHRMTEMQAAFVEAFCEWGDKALAAERAGYSGDNLINGIRLLNTPIVSAAIQIRTMAKLRHAAPAALGAIIELARSAKSETVRLRANETLLDRAGFIAPKAADADPDGNKPLSEMTPDELRDFISKGREQLEAKMMDVTPKPDNAADSAAVEAQVIDMFS